MSLGASTGQRSERQQDDARNDSILYTETTTETIYKDFRETAGLGLTSLSLGVSVSFFQKCTEQVELKVLPHWLGLLLTVSELGLTAHGAGRWVEGHEYNGRM